MAEFPVVVRIAGISDAALLASFRIDHIIAEGEQAPLTESEIGALRDCLCAYFREHITNGTVCAFYATVGGEAVSCAFMTITEHPPLNSQKPNKTGTVLNVYTYPKHRRRGYAQKIMNVLIDEAKRREITMLELSATESAVPLYKKIGFRDSRFATLKMKFSEK